MNDREYATKVIDPSTVPVWEMAHRNLNEQRDALQNELEKRKQEVERINDELAQIENVLNRIAPPTPVSMTADSRRNR